MKERFSCSVIGLGYIGLPTAALVATHRIPVVGVDVNPEVVRLINHGEIHIIEPDLDGLVQRAVRGGLLRATLTPEPADVHLIAVPTPITSDMAPDLSAVHAAARSITPVLRAGDLVILESTSPVGTTDGLVDLFRQSRPDLVVADKSRQIDAMVSVAYCPERVLPGQIIRELVSNDRCVGGVTDLCTKRALAFYRNFVKGECIGTSARTAELVKLSENSFRDLNIAFANTLAQVCERHDIDVWEVVGLANRHPRVNILKPGPGVGGHCIAVDPWFIVHAAPEETQLIRVARETNDARPGQVLKKARAAIGALGPATRVACLGLAFKADIDDLRESPALHIAEELAEELGDRLLIVEPHVERAPAALSRAGVRLVDMDTALDAAAVILVLVDHRAFKTVDPSRYAGKTVIDTRGIWR